MVVLDLENIMQKKNIGLNELSFKSNLNIEELSFILSGEVLGIKLETLDKLLRALNCTPNDLFAY